MNQWGWMLVVVGLVMVGIGLMIALGLSIPWLGRLPGDIRIEGEHTHLYFPITTCIVLSLLLTAVLWLVRRFSR